jgi:hypothetical protein
MSAIDAIDPPAEPAEAEAPAEVVAVSETAAEPEPADAAAPAEEAADGAVEPPVEPAQPPAAPEEPKQANTSVKKSVNFGGEAEADAEADASSEPSDPFYFDDNNVLRHFQTDITVDTQSAIDGNLGPDILDFIGKSVEKQLVDKHEMVVQSIPSADAEARCDFFASKNVATADKMLVIVQNKKKQMPGVWSRGLCISHGLDSGSMLPFVAAGQKAGIAVVVLNANTNYLTIEEPSDGGVGADGAPLPPTTRKVAIEGSSTPEQHIASVWDSVLQPSAAASICFLAYDEGAVLLTDLLHKRADDAATRSRVKAIAFVEPYTPKSEQLPQEMVDFIGNIGVKIERQTADGGADSAGDGWLYSLQSMDANALKCTWTSSRTFVEPASSC